jgi:pentatricopeptide repeat protein
VRVVQNAAAVGAAPAGAATVEVRGNPKSKNKAAVHAGAATVKVRGNSKPKNKVVAAPAGAATFEVRGISKPKYKVSKLQSIRDNKHNWVKAVRLLDEMGTGGRTTAAFDATIRACATGGQVQRALELLNSMEKEGVAATGSTFRSVMNACVKGGEWRKALELFSAMEDKGLKPTTVTINVAISACHLGRQWEKALALLDSMPGCGLEPDVVTFSAAISTCHKSGKWQKALELVQLMEVRGIKPSTISMNAVISACEKGGQWQKALELLESMPRRGLQPDVITMNAAISACEKGGQWQKAVELLEAMPSRGLTPNVISFSAAISACEKGEQGDMALELLALMESRGLEPNAVTLNAAILACHRSGQWQRGQALYEKMPQYRALPDSFTYYAMVYGWVMSGRPEEAVRTLRLLAQSQRELLTVSLFNSALNACNKSPVSQCEAAHDLAKLAREVGVELDKASFSMLMACCAKARDGAGVLSYMQEASRKGIALSTPSLDFVLCQLGRHGLATEAMCVLKLMEANGGLITSGVSYQAVMSACFRAGDYKSLFEVLAAMRASALQPDEVAFSLAIKACELFEATSSGGWRRSIRILKDAEACGVASSALYARVLALLARHGRTTEASALFRDLVSSGKEVAPEHGAAVVTAHYKAGRARGAFDAIEWLEAGGHPLGVAAYTSAVTACRAEGDWERARALYRAFRRRGYAPTAPLFNALLSVYSYAEPREAAVAEVVADMEALGVAKDAGTYTALMSLHAKAQVWPKVLELWADLLANPSVQPTAASAWLAVCSAKRLRDSTTAEGVVDVVEGNELTIGPDFYCTAIEACAGDAAAALRLIGRVNKMDAVKHTLTAECFATAVHACDRAGLWRGALHVLLQMIKAGFQPSADVYNATVRACAQSSEWGMAHRVFQFMRKSGVKVENIDHAEEIAAYASKNGLSLGEESP